MFDNLMRVLIVNSEEELNEKIDAMKTEGFQLAVLSNAGLKAPAKRATFLPASAFKDNS